MPTECEQRLWDDYCETIRRKYGLPADFDFGSFPEPVSPTANCRLCNELICGVADQLQEHAAKAFAIEVA